MNQSPIFENVNLFATDRALAEATEREGAGWASEELSALGRLAGSAHVLELGRLANENPPKLKLIDQKGRRLDKVEFHPAYHELMSISFEHGLHCGEWAERAEGQEPRRGAHVARAAQMFLMNQAESGHLCPITMTHAAFATLGFNEALLARLMPKMVSRDYDPAFAPIGEKTSITIGMGMTEKQGGTDVRANITEAAPLGGGLYSITGHKWFMSAPMCDGFLVLAQAAAGLSCFFMPRFRADGSHNAIRIERLKDKLGNRSNASSEVTFLGAEATLVGEEGRGVPAIIEMVTLTRLDCAVSSAGLMRFTLANALRHAKYRTVFQRKLIDQPLMANVLADLVLESEAATALAFRLARSFDRAGDDPQEAAFRRLMTPVTKYWICKSVPAFAYEAMECLGGNGYVEEGPLARAYREAPLNAIWEGSGNVMCLDILRVMQREPEAVEAVLASIEPAARDDAHLRAALDGLKATLAAGPIPEADARALAERLALIVAASLLTRHAPAAIAEPFAASRLAGGWRSSFGAGLKGADHQAILARAGEGL
ncbi:MULTISPECIES: acyl-CoA dehydrogenase family protein [Rhodomicrobium]|uniref:acyl-CoA dehydrogenase family protein n=1 Tax=Rhodomicrobium TaxID=1068 RepID=UPI001482EF12|nr:MULTISPECIES: acyl-CoA dehydrogenase family protein [Rhodomicrobium]